MKNAATFGAGKPNPAAEVPLPEYAKAWGPAVQRPRFLPELYDTRILPESIFYLLIGGGDHAGSDHTSAELAGSYIVPQRCNRCKHLSQACSRTRPVCARCAKSKSPCCTSDVRYLPLPGPKTERSKIALNKEVNIRRTTVEKVSEGDTEWTGAKWSTSTVRSTARSLRIRIKPVLRYGQILSSRIDPFEDTSDSDTPLASYAAKLLSAQRKKGKNALRDHSAKIRMKVIGKGKKNITPSTQKKRKVGSGLVSQAPRKPAQQSIENGIKWTTIYPPSPAKVVICNDLSAPPNIPRIWAKDKEELREILPAFSQEMSGVVWKEVETPILLIEGPTWPGDSWNGEKSIQLTIVKEFNRVSPAGQPMDSSSGFGAFQCDLISPSSRMEHPGAIPADIPLALHPSPIQSSVPRDSALPPPAILSSTSVQGVRGTLDESGLYRLSPTPDVDTISDPMPPSPQAHPEAIPTDTPLALHPLSIQSSVPNDSALPPPEILSSMSMQGVRGALDESSLYRLSPTPDVGTISDSMPPRPQAHGGLPSWRIWEPIEQAVPSATPSASAALVDGSGSFSQPSTCVMAAEEIMRSAREVHHEHGVRSGNAVDELSDTQQLPSAQSIDSTSVDIPCLELTSTVAMPPPTVETVQLPDRTDVSLDASRNRPLPISESLIAENQPPEFNALRECQTVGVPISVILLRDSPLVPFELPSEYGCLFLGFFTITDLQSEVVITDSVRYNGQVKYKLKLEWTPGGEAPHELPSHPWWMSVPTAEDINASTEEDSMMISHPFTLLPLYLLAASAASEEEMKTDLPESTTTTGWHCTGCGRLNAQRNLRFQKCATCQKSNNIPAVHVNAVRNPFVNAPVSWPWDRPSVGIESNTSEGADGSRTFSYAMGGPGMIKHVFTCNANELQQEPNRLFRDIQLHVELVHRKITKGPATGTYYTYMAADSNTAEEWCIPWADVPECITRARDLIQSRCTIGNNGTPYSIGRLTLLGWVNTGSRKGCYLPAKELPVMILCLGADVELLLSPKTDSTPSQTPVDFVEDPEEPADTVFVSVVPEGVMDGEEGPEAEDTLLNINAEPERPSVPATIVTSTGQGVAVEQQPLKTVLVTLVHGDVLICEGVDFEYSLKRTGMSIVLFGSS